MGGDTEGGIITNHSSYNNITNNITFDDLTTEQVADNVVEIAKQHVVYKLSMYVHTYWLASIIIIGIIGNSISLSVMIQVSIIKDILYKIGISNFQEPN